MANEVTTTTADDLTLAASLLTDGIIDALYENNNAMGVVRYHSIANQPTKAKDFPKTPKIAAAAVAEATDLSNTAFSTTKATLTAGEVGVMLTVTDVQNISSIVDNGYFATETGKAVANKITTDIAALSSGFSTSVGSTTVAITEANVLTAIATLEGASVPGPYQALVHSSHKHALAGAIGGSFSAAATQGESVRAAINDIPAAKPDGMLGELFGIEWYATAAVPTATAGADRLGFLVSRDRAIGFVSQWDIRVEFQRDASMRGTEIIATANYGVGEIDDSSGVGLLTDAI